MSARETWDTHPDAPEGCNCPSGHPPCSYCTQCGDCDYCGEQGPVRDHPVENRMICRRCHIDDDGCGPGNPRCAQHERYGDSHSLGCPRRVDHEAEPRDLPLAEDGPSGVAVLPSPPPLVRCPDWSEIADTLARDETDADDHLPRRAP